jgi:hypothetical protein
MESMQTWLASAAGLFGPYVPRVLGALAIFAVAFVVARLVRAGLTRAAAAAGVDERLHSPGLSATLAQIGYGLVWLLALPALLGTLELEGLLNPVNAMMSRLMGFVPNLVGAIVVLAIGLLVARIVRQLVTGLLSAAGSEKLAERIGLASSLGKDGLAGVAGNVVFALLMLPTAVAALQPLGLDAVTQPLSKLLETVINLIPKLISAAVLVGLAALIGRALASLVSALLAGMGVNRLHETLKLGAPLRVAGRDPSELAGIAVLVACLMVAITQATEVLGLPVLTAMVASLGAALVRIGIGLVVFAVGAILATLAARAIEGSNTANAPLASLMARAAILFFAAALALHQAGLPPEIITIAFGAVVGGIAIGLAVAIGVGGRHVAGRVLERVEASFSGTTGREAGAPRGLPGGDAGPRG